VLLRMLVIRVSCLRYVHVLLRMLVIRVVKSDFEKLKFCKLINLYELRGVDVLCLIQYIQITCAPISSYLYLFLP